MRAHWTAHWMAGRVSRQQQWEGATRNWDTSGQRGGRHVRAFVTRGAEARRHSRRCVLDVCPFVCFSFSAPVCSSSQSWSIPITLCSFARRVSAVHTHANQSHAHRQPRMAAERSWKLSVHSLLLLLSLIDYFVCRCDTGEAGKVQRDKGANRQWRENRGRSERGRRRFHPLCPLLTLTLL